MECDIYAGHRRNDLGGAHSDARNAECWRLSVNEYSLHKDGQKIKLTDSEYKILIAFSSSFQRLLSRDDLILLLSRNPDTYTGLEMCLSRLQQKFGAVWSGCRLIRSVRNHGYCLVQNIYLVADLKPWGLKTGYSTSYLGDDM